MNKSKLTQLALLMAVIGGGAALPSHATEQTDQGLVHTKKDAGTYNASADKSTVAPNSADPASTQSSESTQSSDSALSESPREAATYSTEAYDDSAGTAEPEVSAVAD